MGTPKPRTRSAKPVKPRSTVSKKLKIDIQPQVKSFIHLKYYRMPRSKMAKQLGIDKMTLNMMLIQLGYGG